MHTADSEHLHGSADMQSALLARSSRSTSHERANASAEDLDESLDAVVSAKFFGGFVDAITSVGNALADAGAAVASDVWQCSNGSEIRNVFEGKGPVGSGYVGVHVSCNLSNLREQQQAGSGEAIGSAVGNSAMVVGNRIIQPPKLCHSWVTFLHF